MKNFFMIVNPSKDPELATAKKITAFLKERGCICNVHVRKDKKDKNDIYTDAGQIPSETECILVLGGDGTLIEAARNTVDLGLPLLGINLGSLGFLAEVEKTNIEKALLLLMEDKYQPEQRMMLEGRVERGGQCIGQSHALNDIVMVRSGSLQIVQFRIYVNGQFLNEYSADGVILSTPTGSTGYNMSAGGPIVEPKAKLIVITPICPHTLNTRSVVLSAEDEVIIEMTAGKGETRLRAEVNFDGGHVVELEVGDRIFVRQSEKSTTIVKLNQESFLETLHKKMSEK